MVLFTIRSIHAHNAIYLQINRENGGGGILLIISLLTVAAVSMSIKLWGTFLYDNLLIYRPLLTLSFIAQMLIGSLMLKIKFIEIYKTKFQDHRLLLITLLIGLSLAGIVLNFKLYHFCYIIFLIPTIYTLRRWDWVNKILISLGKNSMIMWLCHAFYYKIILHNFLFSLKYPIIIFLALTAISYITSIILSKPSLILQDTLFSLFKKRILSKKTV